MSALKVDPFNGSGFLCLVQDPADAFQRHCAGLTRASPDEAVIAFEIAFVGQQQMQP
jgi:hypothetical protein